MEKKFQNAHRQDAKKKFFLNRQFFLILLLAAFFLGGCAGSWPIMKSLQGGVQATPEEAIRNAEEYLNTRSDWKIDCSHFVLYC
ncbi:MAG TPA: hypothetical protein VIJ93_10770, partial [bacterium]